MTKTKTPRKPHRKPAKNRWVSGVTTVSTYPPAGLFTKGAATVARTLASKKVSPKGPGMRMLTYFINRAGHGPNQDPPRRTGKGQETPLQNHPARQNPHEGQLAQVRMK